MNSLQGNPFGTSMECGAKRAASRYGVDFDITGTTHYSVATVTQVLNAVTASPPDGVVFMNEDENAYQNPLNILTEEGVKVATLDVAPNDATRVLSTILSNNEEGGRLAAQALLTEGGVDAGDAALVIENYPSDNSHRARGAGFVETMEAAGVNVLPVQYSQEDSTKVSSIVAASLAKYPDLAGVFVTGGTDGPAVRTVLQSEGKSHQISLVEYDASPEQIKSLRNGEILATVAQRPDVEAELAIKYIVASLDGKKVPSEESTRVTLVTQGNVDDPETQRALYRATC